VPKHKKFSGMCSSATRVAGTVVMAVRSITACPLE
jgi:hypothetical protein